MSESVCRACATSVAKAHGAFRNPRCPLQSVRALGRSSLRRASRVRRITRERRGRKISRVRKHSELGFEGRTRSGIAPPARAATQACFNKSPVDRRNITRVNGNRPPNPTQGPVRDRRGEGRRSQGLAIEVYGGPKGSKRSGCQPPRLAPRCWVSSLSGETTGGAAFAVGAVSSCVSMCAIALPPRLESKA